MEKCRSKPCRRGTPKYKKRIRRRRKKNVSAVVAVRYIGKRICGIAISDTLCKLPPQNTSKLNVYSYAVVNRGKETIRARVEVSPNRDDFAFDREATVQSGQTVVIVPTRFLKYTRITLQTVDGAASEAECDVYFQAQTLIGFKPTG
jgi:hypothetical protein